MAEPVVVLQLVLPVKRVNDDLVVALMDAVARYCRLNGMGEPREVSDGPHHRSGRYTMVATPEEGT